MQYAVWAVNGSMSERMTKGADMVNSLIVLGVSTTIGLVQAVFWRWVSGISDAQKSNTQDIAKLRVEVSELKAEIYLNYPTKSDMHKDNDKIMQSLTKIEHQLEKVNDKLDKKADK